MSADGWAKPNRGSRLNVTHPLARDLVGAWLLNEGTGNQVHDVSRFGNHGTVAGYDSTDAWRGGPHGMALGGFVGGSADSLPFGSTAGSFAAGQSFSVLVWSYGGILWPSSGTLVVSKNGVWPWVDPGWRIVQVRTGQVAAFGLNSTSGDTLASGTSNILNGWHQLVGVYDADAAEIRIYVDAILEGTASSVPPDAYGTNATQLQIGDDSWQNGAVSTLNLWGRALDVADIRWLYQEPYAMFGGWSHAWVAPAPSLVVTSPTRFGAVAQRIQASDTTERVRFNNETERVGYQAHV